MILDLIFSGGKMNIKILIVCLLIIALFGTIGIIYKISAPNDEAYDAKVQLAIKKTSNPCAAEVIVNLTRDEVPRLKHDTIVVLGKAYVIRRGTDIPNITIEDINKVKNCSK